jgi:hypothetical protein
MEPLVVFCAFLIYHWFADFKFQTHWMAVNKSKDNWALFLHVCTYIGVFSFFIFCIYVGWLVTGNVNQNVLFKSLPNLIGFLGVNFILHFITDYITSRITSRLWKEEKVHDFFEVVGLDQLIHQITLAVTMYYFFFRV